MEAEEVPTNFVQQVGDTTYSGEAVVDIHLA